MTQTAEYALRAVVVLGLQPESLMTTREIAERTNVPLCYLAKVLKALARAGLVVSHRGPGGGFGINRPVGEVTLLDVINAVDPIRRFARCPMNLVSHQCHLCRLYSRIDAGLSMLESTFACSTIADAIGELGAFKPTYKVARKTRNHAR